nr:hypothetical protein BgiMline_005237 [Biomphalaria glabrata]
MWLSTNRNVVVHQQECGCPPTDYVVVHQQECGCPPTDYVGVHQQVMWLSTNRSCGCHPPDHKATWLSPTGNVFVNVT